LLSAIAAAVLAVSTLYSAPAVEAPESQVIEVQQQAKKAKKDKCKDPVVKWIREAGFTGGEVRVAWSIAQRESNGNPN
jgi:hypothetical protein